MEPNTPNINPSTPMVEHDHKKLLNLLVVLVIVGAIIGLVYWWTIPNVSKPTVSKIPTNAERAQIAESLRASNVQISQTDKEKVASELSASNVSMTNEEKANIAASLKSSQ